MPNEYVKGNWLKCPCGTQTYLSDKDDYIATCSKCKRQFGWKTTFTVRSING